MHLIGIEIFLEIFFSKILTDVIWFLEGRHEFLRAIQVIAPLCEMHLPVLYYLLTRVTGIRSRCQLTLERKLAWEKLCREQHIDVMSRSQLLESVLFKDSSYHKIIDNEFAFTVSPSVYKELLEAGYSIHL